MRQILRVTWYRVRVTFSRRVGGYVSLILLIGLVGGVSLGSLAGARRTDSSFPTYLASTNPSTLLAFASFDDPAIGIYTGYAPKVNRAIAHLPLVKAIAQSVGYDGNVDLNSITGVHLHVTSGETPPAIIGGNEYLTMDRVTLVSGRLFTSHRTNEAVINAQAAKEVGVHLGSVIGIPFYTDSQSKGSPGVLPHLIAKVKIVGIVVFGRSIVQDDIDALGSAAVLLSPALNRELRTCCAYYSGVAIQVKGGVANVPKFRNELARVDPISRFNIGGGSSPAIVDAKAQQAIQPEAVALGVFGAIAALATLLIAGLIIARMLRAGAEESATLRALGASRSMVLGEAILGLFSSVIAGGLLGGAVAFAVSPLAPLGPVRPVYPNGGFSVDGTVLGYGSFLFVVLLCVFALALALRESNRGSSGGSGDSSSHEPRLVRSAAASPLPISVVTGVRFALEPGRQRDAAPVRAAIVGATLAMTVLVATVTFGASLDNLVSHPRLFGWNWDYALLSGFAGQEDMPQQQTAAAFNHDPFVEAWSGVNFASGTLDGLALPMMAERPGAPVEPPLLSGHGLRASNQVVLGGSTLAALHKHVGDTVIFSDAADVHRRLLIVGTATFTPVAKGLEMGVGALVATSNFSRKLLNPQQNSIAGPNAVLFRLRSVHKYIPARNSLIAVEKKIDAVRGDQHSSGGFVKVLRPAEIVNYRSMGTTPAILGGGLAFGAVAALGLTLIASVRRRRRDLALLKALGFTQHQLRAAIAWQSSIAVAIGTVVGVPVGLLLGRWLWNLFAHEIHAVPAPSVPGALIGLIILGALVLANVVAAVPGRVAASTPTALVLRRE